MFSLNSMQMKKIAWIQVWLILCLPPIQQFNVMYFKLNTCNVPSVNKELGTNNVINTSVKILNWTLLLILTTESRYTKYDCYYREIGR